MNRVARHRSIPDRFASVIFCPQALRDDYISALSRLQRRRMHRKRVQGPKDSGLRPEGPQIEAEKGWGSLGMVVSPPNQLWVWWCAVRSRSRVRGRAVTARRVYTIFSTQDALSWVLTPKRFWIVWGKTGHIGREVSKRCLEKHCDYVDIELTSSKGLLTLRLSTFVTFRFKPLVYI